MEEEDPIFNIDLDEARRVKPGEPETAVEMTGKDNNPEGDSVQVTGTPNDSREKSRKPILWSDKDEQIDAKHYPLWMVNWKNEPEGLNQHYCLLHIHDLLAMEANIFGRPCHFCKDELIGHYILHCPDCDYNICDGCHKKKT